MSLAVSLQNLANFVRLAPAQGSAAAPAGSPPRNRAALLQLQGELFRLFEAIVDLDIAVNGRSALRLDLPDARSEPALGLDLSSFAARLASTEEINATPTSFTPFGPDWDDGSNALLTVLGVYDGSNGSGDLSFEVRQAGERGVDRLRIRVRDPQDNIIRNFTIRENDPLDREYDLFNGLSVTIGAGSLFRFDTTSIQVADSIGSVVDTGNAFNGLRNDNPNLQFGLPAIADGAFLVNGETISVNVTDSVNSVIQRINQSAAGVTAQFNPLTESIDFVQDTPGEAPTIILSGDTSNFLQATKLSAAAVTPGKDPDNERRLADVGIFGGTSSGQFRINNQDIDLDVDSDSLDDVLARINAAGVGANASFDPASGRVTLTATEAGRALEIDSNGTGLFAALNLPEGRVDPQARRGGVSERRLRRIGDAVEAVADGLNSLFSDRGLLNGQDPSVIALRGQISSAIASILGGGDGRLDSGIGLQFNRDPAVRASGEFVEFDRRKLFRYVEKRGSQVRSFFNGDKGQTGFTVGLASVIEKSIRSSVETLGSRGILFDALA